MEARKLRISDDNSVVADNSVMPEVDTNRSLRIKNTEILEKIDRLSILSDRLSTKKLSLKKKQIRFHLKLIASNKKFSPTPAITSCQN